MFDCHGFRCDHFFGHNSDAGNIFLGNVCGQHSSLWTLIISGLFGIFRDDLGFLGASHDISGFLGVFYGFRGGGGQAPNMKYEMTGRYWV